MRNEEDLNKPLPLFEYGQHGNVEAFTHDSFCENLRMGKIPIVIICGPNGVGKGSIINELTNNTFLPVAKLKRVTSKELTPSDSDLYIPFNQDNFQEMVLNNRLLEWSYHVPGYYGTPIEAVNELANRGMTPLIDIDIEAGLLIKRILSNCGIKMIDILILPASEKLLESDEGMQLLLTILLQRMMSRNRITDSNDLIGRIKRSGLLLQNSHLFTHKVINNEGKLIYAVQEVVNIISKYGDI